MEIISKKCTWNEMNCICRVENHSDRDMRLSREEKLTTKPSTVSLTLLKNVWIHIHFLFLAFKGGNMTDRPPGI